MVVSVAHDGRRRGLGSSHRDEIRSLRAVSRASARRHGRASVRDTRTRRERWDRGDPSFTRRKHHNARCSQGPMGYRGYHGKALNLRMAMVDW